MRQNLEKALEWSAREGHSAVEVSACWDELQLAVFPPGVDYYVLDCGLLYGRAVAHNWYLACVLNPTIPLSVGSLAATIERMDIIRRRRVRMEPEWQVKPEALMNRLLRSKKRALKLVKEMNGEISDEPDDSGLNGHGSLG